MNSSEAAALPVRHFPSRIASLGFAMRLPADWVSHDLPFEKPDFADPSRLVPLAAVTAPHAAIVWAAAARPAYGDGTVSDWARYLLAQHGLAVRSFTESRLGMMPALIGEAGQPSDMGPLCVRFAFAEDGGRLIHLSLTAPAMLADAVQGLWTAAIDSFTLEQGAGPTVSLWPGLQAADATSAPAAPVQPKDQSHATALADAKQAQQELAQSVSMPADPVPATPTQTGLARLGSAQLGRTASRPLPAADGQQTQAIKTQPVPTQPFDIRSPEPETLALPVRAPEPGSRVADAAATHAVGAPPPDALHHHALADDATTLDPDNATNRRLRDSGIGLVPRVVAVDRAGRCATVACAAISAQIEMPLGWHVIDDGRRVLIFEPAGDVQVHLDLLPSEQREARELLDEIELQIHRDYPAPECMRLASGRMVALNVRNIHDGDEPIEQFHLLVQGPDTRHMLRARVTATVAKATASANLGELVLNSAVFGSFAIPAAAGETGPDWWMAALLLERANRLNEAEDCITSAVDHIGAALQVAELYRHRMLRLLRAGDNAGAEQARVQAVRWVQHYAASATSGGEGAALSRERDAFLARL